MRKLATIRRIDRIDPIAGADAIEVATVGGWKVVIKKGEYQAGDLAVYLEVDSWVPTELAPFLTKGKEPREYNGVKGERLRTIKLRGQISQGLLLPWTVGGEGDDMTELLGIQKWEKPIPAELSGVMRGSFPTEIPKTDQERCQNLVNEIRVASDNNLLFEVTEKLEGSSMTVYRIRGEFGVCSRNIDLAESDTNTFWKVARELNLENIMRDNSLDNFAIQGELIGPSVQGNIYGLTNHVFAVFDVYDIQAGQYLRPKDRHELIARLGLVHVPVLAMDKDLGTGEVDYILEWADGKSVIGSQPAREGIVFKQINGGMTFKAISNQYLMRSE